MRRPPALDSGCSRLPLAVMAGPPKSEGFYYISIIPHDPGKGSSNSQCRGMHRDIATHGVWAHRSLILRRATNRCTLTLLGNQPRNIDWHACRPNRSVDSRAISCTIGSGCAVCCVMRQAYCGPCMRHYQHWQHCAPDVRVDSRSVAAHWCRRCCCRHRPCTGT